MNLNAAQPAAAATCQASARKRLICVSIFLLKWWLISGRGQAPEPPVVGQK
jgi:hypothetical protein